MAIPFSEEKIPSQHDISIHWSRFAEKLSVMLLAGVFCFAAYGAESVVIFAFGDTGECGNDGTRRLADILASNPRSSDAIVLELGDLAYPVGVRERLLECHEKYLERFPRRYAVPGNHDWADPGAAGFFSLFPSPLPRVVALSAHWRLLLLNSNLEGQPGNDQLDWLQQELRHDDDRCTIAAWHHPRWSSGRHGDSKRVGALWNRVAGRVSLTLHGHDHHYENLEPRLASGSVAFNGTRSFIVGTGGAWLYPPHPIKPGSSAVFSEWGYLELTLSKEAYQWRWISIDGRSRDQGGATCKPG